MKVYDSRFCYRAVPTGPSKAQTRPECQVNSNAHSDLFRCPLGVPVLANVNSWRVFVLGLHSGTETVRQRETDTLAALVWVQPETGPFEALGAQRKPDDIEACQLIAQSSMLVSRADFVDNVRVATLSRTGSQSIVSS